LVEKPVLELLQEAVGTPAEETLAASRRRVRIWFEQTALLIRWDVLESPLGSLYVAVSDRGLYRLDFSPDPDAFLNTLDPLARTERNPAALAPVAGQLREYFAGARSRFDLPLDLSRLSPFQRRVLQTARQIPAGSVWTYRQVAQVIGQPQASRAVGQALGRNPIPIVIPCHRVVRSSGELGGYRGGLDRKRQLLRLEGAL